MTNPMTQAVGWALVHFLWQGTLVAAGLAAGLALMKGRSSQARYALAVGTLAVMVLLPVATAFRSYEPAAPVAQKTPSPALPRFAVEGAPAAPAPTETAVDFREMVRPWVPSLLRVWLAGVALFTVWHLAGWVQTRRMTRRGTRPVEEQWELALVRLRRRLGIRNAVSLLESAAVPVPAVIGWLRPVILVPASAFAGLAPQQLEAILAHELAHVRRNDYLINLLQAVAETLLFYHPAVWWVSRQVRQERESCCDDLAVAVCGDRLGYARALATLEDLRRTTPHLALGADGGSLLRRIRRLAGVPEKTGGAPVAWIAGALALSLLLAGAAVDDGARASLGLDGLDLQILEPATVVAQATAPSAPPAPSRKSGDRGQWTAERTNDGDINLQISYSSPNGKGRSNHGTDYDPSELAGFRTGNDIRFELRRAAGTFHFEGRFDGEMGQGTFTFQGNPSYIPEMSRLGYKVEQDDLFQLALFDVSPSYVAGLRDVGYDGLTLEQLVEFRIFGVDAELVRSLREAGHEDLPASKLVELKIHGATPEFAREMAELGYRDLSLDRLVEFRIHGVTPDFIREIADAGHEGVSANDLVAMRIHGVDAEFIRKTEARAGRKMEIEDIIDKKILGWRD